MCVSRELTRAVGALRSPVYVMVRGYGREEALQRVCVPGTSGTRTRTAQKWRRRESKWFAVPIAFCFSDSYRFALPYGEVK